MALAVVWCPACRGASRVAADSLGHRVACPRCRATFVAREESPSRKSRSREPREARPPRPARPLPTEPAKAPQQPSAERPAKVIPIAPPRNTLPRNGLVQIADPIPHTSAAPHDPEHDPHTPRAGRIPLSVLIGMALAPIGIPLLWFAAPHITGQAAALSLAVPISLAIAASALCLGVVHTIDWTATTRVKGVLMLVALAYLSGAGLYFLKKDLVERVQRFGAEPVRWNDVDLEKGKSEVRMPGHAWDAKIQPLPGIAEMTRGKEAHIAPDADGPQYVYRIAVGKPVNGAPKPDDVNAWFDRVGKKLEEGGALAGPPEVLAHRGQEQSPGRQWTFNLPENNVRIVRVFVIKGSVYYLSAEGPGLRVDDDELGKRFFDTFLVK